MTRRQARTHYSPFTNKTLLKCYPALEPLRQVYPWHALYIELKTQRVLTYVLYSSAQKVQKLRWFNWREGGIQVWRVYTRTALQSERPTSALSVRLQTSSGLSDPTLLLRLKGCSVYVAWELKCDDWLAEWLAGWQSYRLAGWLAGRLGGWLTGWPTGWLADRVTSLRHLPKLELCLWFCSIHLFLLQTELRFPTISC